ncbi:MAG: ABC transporter substrate-binding protein [Gemmatimonadaceae bacterium]|nr:ABC transporter substrate-binding protein [Acetobacteraceae bacterium]
MLPRRTLLAAATTLSMPGLLRAQGAAPIRVGEINSYTAQPAFTLPYRNGMELAVDVVNRTGVLGRKIELLVRDDAGKPQDAIRLAGELVGDQKVDLLAGGFLSNVGLALGDYALQNKKLFIAGEPLTDALVWEKGNRYTYRLRPSTYMQAAMLVADAAKLPAKRWVTVAPNYEYGQSAVKWFKALMLRARPDIQFVAEQWPALGRIDAGATVQALAQANPEAIFNVTFAADLTNFVRAGNTRGLFERRSVVSLLTGEPEYLDPLGDEAPEGWIVTGYPIAEDKAPANQAFVNAYQDRFKTPPRMGSVVGYALIQSIAAGILKSGSTETEAMADGFAGARFESPLGPVTWRAVDHQGTLGGYVGTLGLKDGKGLMDTWRYVDGADVLPPDDVVRTLRPA